MPKSLINRVGVKNPTVMKNLKVMLSSGRCPDPPKPDPPEPDKEGTGNKL